MSTTYHFVKDQCDRLVETITDEGTFSQKYTDIVDSIVPSIEGQVGDHVRSSILAIKRDAIEEILRDTDIDAYKKRVLSHFSTNSVTLSPRPVSLNMPRLTKGKSIKNFNIDYITDAYMRIDDEKEKYSRKVSQFSKYCKEYLEDVRQFEEDMQLYRQELVRYGKSLLDDIVDNYEFHLFNLQNNREAETGRKFHLSDGRECEYGTSIAEFIGNVLHAIF